MTDTESLAQIQQDIYISRILIVVPYTILVYEYLLTLEQEVSRFWGTRLTWGTFFFYLNRYSSLFGTLPILVQYYSTTTDPKKMPRNELSTPFQTCRAFRAYHQYFALVSQVLVAIMLIMRTFALYERSRLVLGFTLVVTLAAFVFAVSILLTGTNLDAFSAQVAAFGCPIATPHDKSLRLAAAWSGMLVFDVMIFAFTLFKALKLNSRRGDLLTVLIRDGSIYFALMITSNACNIGTYTMGGPFISGTGTTVTNVCVSISLPSSLFLPVPDPLALSHKLTHSDSLPFSLASASSILISRLCFNLRDPLIRLPPGRRHTTTTTTTTQPEISTMGPYSLGTELEMDTRWTNMTGMDVDVTDEG
ncbi:hypothetical protein B0H11DRAFT_2237713 [Mycena galericulata]|nr:hypothetical protein B0H11DRAFT_2237713 [Mycena galericulata]